MGTPQHIQVATLEDIAVWIWECAALERTGDPAEAKRLTAARYWVESRRPGADGRRIVHGRGGPRREDR